MVVPSLLSSTPSMRLSTIYFRFPVTEHTHQSSSWRIYLSVAGPASASVCEFHGHGYRGLQVVWGHAELRWAGPWSQGESLAAQAQGHLLLLKEKCPPEPRSWKTDAMLSHWPPVTAPPTTCLPLSPRLLLRIQAHVPTLPPSPSLNL